MTYFHTFDNKVRFLVIYQDVSKKASVIAKYTSINLRTIYDWIKKIENNVNIMEHAEGQGRKATIALAVKNNVVRKTRRSPNSSSTRSLGLQYGMSKTTAGTALKEKNFKYGRPQKVTTLDPDEKNKRVKYCQTMLNANGKRIYSSVFTDEMGINLSDCYSENVWNPPRKKVKVEVPRQDIWLSCWAGISYNGATTLHIYKNSLKADTYLKIVEEHKHEMDELYPNGYLYQHDNSSVHVAAEDDMKRQKFKFMEFPTYSPDLSPIENLWSALKVAVAKDNPKNETSLRRSLHNNWRELTQVDKLHAYFDVLFDRYNECIEKKGIRLRY